MKIIIVGYGFVGKAVKNALESKHDIVIVDPAYSEESIKNHPDADGVIVCVPTPSTSIGTCDGKHVFEVLDSTLLHLPVLIKSTISPDLVDTIIEMYPDLAITFSPEFLRAKSAHQDFMMQKYMVLGGEDPECFWQELFTSTLPNCKMIFNCTAKEASIIKYATNSFLAVKTSFFNHLYDVCDSSNADFNIVRHIITHDQRIGADHSMVPGPDGERGWGGHCFPKDTLAFVQWAQSIHAPIGVLETAIEYNNSLRKILDKQ